VKDAKALEDSMRNVDKYTVENPFYIEDGVEEIEENEEEFMNELNLPSHVGGLLLAYFLILSDISMAR
jgi:hypothetical protein